MRQFRCQRRGVYVGGEGRPRGGASLQLWTRQTRTCPSPNRDGLQLTELLCPPAMRALQLGTMDDMLSKELSERRARMRALLRQRSAPLGDSPSRGKGDALLLFSAPVFLRNGDVEHTYRQHSDFYYLTGFEEPESALLLTAEDATAEEPGFTLFVRERDRERETWDGRRAGTLGAKEEFGADQAFPIEQLTFQLANLLENRRKVFFLWGEEERWTKSVFDVIAEIRGRRRKRVFAPTELGDARVLLHEGRLFKSEYEQKMMAEVGQISALAHKAAMSACREGMTEWQLQDVVENEFRRAGSRRLAYDSIVGSGANGTILHYRENSSTMKSGDLVLIDAGAEYNYVAADITRTFPVNGRFSAVQARLYQIVLDAQLKAIEACQVGATMDDVHAAAAGVIRAGLVAENLIGDIEATDDEAMTKRVAHFFMHKTSHYLGMDVHDVGTYFADGQPRTLEPGMVITVEPGLYFATDDETVPQPYRGIGIRIEDDVLITADGPKNLTASAPKTVQEVEAACAGD